MLRTKTKVTNNKADFNRQSFTITLLMTTLINRLLFQTVIQ